jgi:hypothetical protein
MAQKQAPIFVTESALDYVLDGLLLVYLALMWLAWFWELEKASRMRLFKISYSVMVSMGTLWVFVYRDEVSAPGNSIRKT